MIDDPDKLAQLDKLWRPDPGDPTAFDAAVYTRIRERRVRNLAFGGFAVAAVVVLFILPPAAEAPTHMDTAPPPLAEDVGWYAAALDNNFTPENDLLNAALFGGLED